jgi:hypothetical protein
MWLLASVPLDGSSTSRKWVNWRDLYHPLGFVRWHILLFLPASVTILDLNLCEGLSKAKALILQWPTK